jgi:hypothetical protein
MAYLKAAVVGNLSGFMKSEVVRVAGGLKRAVARAGAASQADLRAQARAGGFADGGKALANSWRLQVFPRPGVGPTSFRPAADVTSRMPRIAQIFDRGALVRARGGTYLAIPTPVNRIGKRDGAGKWTVRVTAQEMIRGGGFVVYTNNPRCRLWCLPLRTETSKRGRVSLFAGQYAQIFTGKMKGAAAARAAFAASRSFVPMFFLMRQVALKKRLDVAAVRRLAAKRFARAAAEELRRR